MKSRRDLGLLLASAVLAGGCYALVTTTVSYSTPTTWTGTGRGIYGSTNNGRGVGLAGQRMVLFEGSPPDGIGTVVLDNPLGEYFPDSSYVLRSYTQTLATSWTQYGVLVANAVGANSGPDLFVQESTPSRSGWKRARPASALIWEAPVDAITWAIEEICDVAAITQRAAPSYTRLFAAVRARKCGRACSDALRAGVAEIELLNNAGGSTSWRVVSNEVGLGNAGMYDEDGNTFSDECMPIDVTTSLTDQVGHRLVVADPSADAILMYDVTRLRSGPIDVIRTPDATRSPVDIAILADRRGGVDYTFVVTLWRGSATPQLRHHNGTLRGLGDTPHLTESMPSDVRFIQGQLQEVPPNPPFRGELYTLGSRVIRRTYEF